MRAMAFSAALLFAALLIAPAPPIAAQAPELREILPRGATRGAEVTVRLTGRHLAGAADVLFHDPGIRLVSITPDPENENRAEATFAIAEDCRPGTHAMRVRTPRGVSNLLLFSVGTLEEIEEIEPNNAIAEAMPVSLGVTVNGRITLEDVDFFAVELEAGQRMAVEIEGLRLGGELFDPKLRLFNASGHELLVEDDTQLFGQDAGFVHASEDGGTYYIEVSDARYGGANNYWYRLHIGEFPRPFAVTPWGGAPGGEVAVRWLGDPGAPPQTLSIPEDAPAIWAALPETENGTAPTPVPFRVADLPGVLESEQNDSFDTATPGAAPGAFDGVIGAPGDVDFFSFEGQEGQVFDVRVWARELGSPLDPVLAVLRPDGRNLARDDDGAGGLDSQLRVTLPEDGVYGLRVRDHLRRGGEEFAYRIEVTQAETSLRLSVLENRPVQLAAPRGNHAYLLVNASRSGFDGPIALSLLDAPEGLEYAGEPIPAGQGVRPMLISVAEDAPEGGALARLEGRFQDDAREITGGLSQEVRLIGGENDTTFFGRQVDRIALAVTAPAPFRISVDAPGVPVVHDGHTYLTVRADRAEDFDEAIALRVPWLPTGLSAGTASIAEGETEARIRLECSGNAAAGAHQFLVEGAAGGYTLCAPFTTVEVQEPWVRFEIAEIETERGQLAPLTVTPAFSREFPGAFEVHLRGLPNGVETTPQSLTHGMDALEFPLEVAEDARAGRYTPISAVVTIETEDGAVPHVGGSGQLTVHDPLPENLRTAAPEPETPEDEDAAPQRRTRFPAS